MSILARVSRLLPQTVTSLSLQMPFQVCSLSSSSKFQESENAAYSRLTQDRVIVTLSKGMLFKKNDLGNETAVLSCKKAIEGLNALHNVNPNDPKVVKWALLKPVNPGIGLYVVKHVFSNRETTEKTARQIEAYINKGHSALKQPKNQ